MQSLKANSAVCAGTSAICILLAIGYARGASYFADAGEFLLRILLGSATVGFIFFTAVGCIKLAVHVWEKLDIGHAIKSIHDALSKRYPTYLQKAGALTAWCVPGIMLIDLTLPETVRYEGVLSPNPHSLEPGQMLLLGISTFAFSRCLAVTTANKLHEKENASVGSDDVFFLTNTLGPALWFLLIFIIVHGL